MLKEFNLQLFAELGTGNSGTGNPAAQTPAGGANGDGTNNAGDKGDGTQTTGDKTYTQADLDKIVNERSERAGNALFWQISIHASRERGDYSFITR